MTNRKTKKKDFFRNVNGTILPAAALLLAVIIPLTGLAVDMGYYGILRGSLEKATEAGAVAGAQEYFRSMADGGKAVNETLKVFKMNVTSETRFPDFHHSTGSGRPDALTFSQSFSQGLDNIFRDSSISVTVMTSLDRGKITVTSEMTPNTFLSQTFAPTTPIRITKEAELPPYDVAFVVDLSGSMRFTTVKTYVGPARRKPVGAPGTGALLGDVILYTGPYFVLGIGQTIVANGFETRVEGVTDVIINTPGNDIPANATYRNTGNPIYVNDPKRGYVTRVIGSYNINRPYSTVFSGITITEARNSANQELRGLAQSYDENRSRNRNIYREYYDRATQYVEPHASTVYGIRTFIDTVRYYGTSTLNLGLVTFSSSSSTSDQTLSTNFKYDLLSNNTLKNVSTTHPYIPLIQPRRFLEIPEALTIMLGNLTPNSIGTNGVPEGGTNTNSGLDNALRTFERGNRRNAQRVVILFTDGVPSHSMNSLGNKVRSFTDQGITVYSIVLTTGIGEGEIASFRNAIENTGRAQPVILIDDPVQLEDAFLQIADQLGLKLTV